MLTNSCTISVFDVTSTGGCLERMGTCRYREKHLPEHHGGENALGSVLTQAGTNLRKERPTPVGIHQGEIFLWAFPALLISYTCPQSMHEILDELHTFPGVFGSVVDNLANVPQDIMQYVKYLILQLDPYLRVSDDCKPRQNVDPVISTTVRAAGTHVHRGLHYRIKLDVSND